MLEALLEAIFSIISEAFLTAVFYWPGWLVLRILTLGYYPPPRGTPHNELFVAMFGAASLVTLFTSLLAR